LASQRSHDERVWSRKADAYAEIFRSIEAMQACYAAWEAQELLRQELSDERETQLRDENTEAHRILRSTVAANSWLLDINVEKRCQDIHRALGTHHDSWFEHVDASSHELSLATSDLKALALAELGRPKLFK
jgi:hypothetical protein